MTLNEIQEAKLRTRGHIHWIDKKSNIIYKIYKKVNLLDDLNNIKTRLSQIVKLSCAMEFIPETNYSYEEDLLVMKQKRLAKDKELKEIEPLKKLLLIKTKSENVQVCKKLILKYHNYDVPEIVLTDGDILNDAYRDWFIKNT